MEKFKKNFILLSICFIIWIAVNSFLYPRLVDLVIGKKYPVYIFHLYYFGIYCLIGLLIGWSSDSKGWVLSLIFGAIISILFVSVSLFANFLEIELRNFGYKETMYRLLLNQAIFIAYLVFGGFIGGRLRSMQHREPTKPLIGTASDK